MKVLFLIDTMRSGGRERQLAELLKSLSIQKNVSCELVVMSHETHYREILDLGVPIHYLVRKNKKDISIFWQLYQLCRRFRPDIIHSWDTMTSVYALPSIWLLGIRFVNNFIQNAPSSISVLDRDGFRSRLTFPFSDVVVANSHAGLKAYAAPINKSRVIHNGFDFERIARVMKKEEMRANLGVHGEKVVGMVASFTDTKDYSTFLAAAQKVLLRRKDVVFVAVGDGENLQRMKQIIEQRNAENILFLGKQSDVESIINVFDVGVLATYTEGISNSIMEYMALGKPAVATDGGGTIELLIDGETAFLVPPKNPDEMAEKIEYLLDNPERAHSMGSAGKERIKREFSMEQMTAAFLSLYNELIENHS